MEVAVASLHCTDKAERNPPRCPPIATPFLKDAVVVVWLAGSQIVSRKFVITVYKLYLNKFMNIDT
jgi:hypothetical protein